MKKFIHSKQNLLIASLVPLIFCFSCTPEKKPVENEPVTSDTKQLAASWADSAQALMYQHWNWRGSEKAFQKAIELDPQLDRIYAHYGWLKLLQKDSTGGLATLKRAVELNPDNPLWHSWVGWASLWTQPGQAMEALERALEVDPEFAVALYLKGWILAERGDQEAALEALTQAAKDPRWAFGLGVGHAHLGNKTEAMGIVRNLSENLETWNIWGIAEIYSILGERENALTWLEKAYDQHHPYIPWIEHNQNFRSVKGEARFQAIVDQLKLPYT